MSQPKKSGRASRAEIKYVKDYMGAKTVQEIAVHLQRSVEFVRGCAGVDEDGKALLETRSNFRTRPEHKNLKREFTPDELADFEMQYVNWCQQFNNEITASEDTQIFLVIKLNILIGRCLAEKKKLGDMINEREREISHIALNKLADSPDGRERKMKLSETVTSLRTAEIAHSRTFLELVDKHAKQLRDLKATREQRVKVHENAKNSFIDLIKSLQSDDFRRQEGKQIELAKIAMEREYKRLSQPFKFADNVVDLPLLNSDTVKNLTEESP